MQQTQEFAVAIESKTEAIGVVPLDDQLLELVVGGVAALGPGTGWLVSSSGPGTGW